MASYKEEMLWAAVKKLDALYYDASVTDEQRRAVSVAEDMVREAIKLFQTEGE